MLHNHSSSVSPVVPDETDKTVLSTVWSEGGEKNEERRILFHIHSVVGHVFAARTQVAYAFLIYLRDINKEWNSGCTF